MRPRSDGTEGGLADLRQVWFSGAHCNVGGGYPESESGLLKLNLKWMIDEAMLAGLIVDDEKDSLILGKRGQDFAQPDADAILHQSLTPAWRPFEYLPSLTGRGRYRMAS
jgi:hypothetical protein